jgi:putative tryptophan/tyrosine transport system substrate-binding protein
MRLIGLTVILAVGLILAPVAAVAQQARKVYRIGYLTSFPIDDSYAQSFRQGLRELGYVEGRDVVIEGRSSYQRPNDLEKLAAELVAAKVDVIVAGTGVAALAAKRLTAEIPIVMQAASDAVTQGLVASLARPGGNVTGMTKLAPELTPKRLEILKEALPRLKRTTALWCPESQISHVELRDSRMAAERLQLQLEPVPYRANASWDAVAESLRLNLPDALVIFDCPAVPTDAVVDLALKHRLPTISAFEAVSRRGGLLSYGADLDAISRRAAVFVDKILKGAKPADLPVEQPTKFELVINLKTAKAIGLTIPPSVLGRADHVIE